MGKCYRCGYCGQPTDSGGSPLGINEINAMAVDWDKADNTHGYCCAQEFEHERQLITRERAMDACDMSLEGEWF